MSIFSKSTALTLTLCFVTPVLAQDVTIGSLGIPGLFTEAKDGAYDAILAEAANTGGFSLDIQRMPPARAIASFESGALDCLVPADPDFFTLDFQAIQSKPMNLGKIYIFTAAGSEPLNNLSDLSGKKVGSRLGMPYGADVENAGLDLQEAKTIEANIKKLEAGRLDAFIAYVPDAWDAFSALGMEPLPHDAANPVAVHEDSITCQDTPAAREMIDKLDASLSQLEADGKLKTILGSAYTLN